MEKEKHLKFNLRGEDDPKGLQTIQITVGPCSVMDMADYRVELRTVFDWYSEKTGEPYLETDEQVEDIGDEHWPMFSAGLRRARMLAAVKEVQYRNGDDKGWEEGELPEEWEGLEKFVVNMPPVLFETWDRVANEVNPGLWIVDTDEDSKKEGWLSVD